MRIFVFGSSITSCYWNGAATYYRGIYKNLAALGHEITFAEPDIYERQQNRDRREVELCERDRLPHARRHRCDCSRKPPARTWSSSTAAWAPTTNCSRRAFWNAARPHPGGLLGRRCAGNPGPRRTDPARSLSAA